MAADFNAQAAAEVDGQEVRDKISPGRQRLDVPDNPFMERVLKWIVTHHVEHLHGPEEMHYYSQGSQR